MFSYSIENAWNTIPGSVLGGCRPTVVGLLFTRREELILVQPSKGAFGTFIPPQGGVEDNELLALALIREMREELPGVEIDRRTIYYLGDCRNELPPEREVDAVGHQHKWLFFLAARLLHDPIEADGQENLGFCRVRGSTQLLPAITAARPQKQRMIIEAVNRAENLGVIGWSVRVPQEQMVA